MAKQQANLPSNAFKEGKRGNIAITNIANDDKNRLKCNMEELILDARMDEHGQGNENDLKELQNQSEKMVRGTIYKNSEAAYNQY